MLLLLVFSVLNPDLNEAAGSSSQVHHMCPERDLGVNVNPSVGLIILCIREPLKTRLPFPNGLLVLFRCAP